MRYHYLDQYIASAQHKITVNLIGAGGTGSHMLTNLATLFHAFVKLGKQPLFVRVFDPDIVEEHNIGRQMFSMSDVGAFKSDVLVTRCNRYFGTEWISLPIMFGNDMDIREQSIGANFIISCVDSVKSRKGIAATFPKKNTSFDYQHPQYSTIYYWMDIGNSKKTGQIILGTARDIEQPIRKLNEFPVIYTVSHLPNFIDEFPKIREKKQEPSCSLAESLGRQDLFINKTMATFASNMLWQLMMEFRINYRGIYINLESLKTQPITI